MSGFICSAYWLFVLVLFNFIPLDAAESVQEINQISTLHQLIHNHNYEALIMGTMSLLVILITALIFVHLRFRRLTRRMQNEQSRMIEKLDNHVANEHIFNQCLQKISIEEDFSDAVQQMLETIGSHIGADRTYVFRYRDEIHADNIYEWTAPGISPQMCNLQNMDMNSFPNVQEKMLMKHYIEFADTKNPPQDMRETGEFLRQQEIQSAILCGIWEQDSLWGFIGMDFVRSVHSFTESDRQTLDNAANLFLFARERKQQLDVISESLLRQKTYVENEKIINASLTQMVQDENFDRNINRILKILANQLDSDRAYYGQYKENNGYEITHEWLSSGVDSLHTVRDPRFKQQFLIWKEKFQRNELLEIPDIHNSSYAEILREPGCRTLLCAPVMVNQNLAGIIGLGFIRRKRDISALDETMIRSVAQIISVALQRDAKHRELEKAVGELEKAVQSEQAANRAKSYFLATMSHEIRTPLNAVIGFSELLKNSSLTMQEQTEYLDSITLAGNSLLRLINDVLDLSKLEAEQMVLTPQTTDLYALFQEIQAIFRYKAQEKQLFFHLDYPENVPALKLDNLRLRQILLNLVGNAVKYTENGGITLGFDFTKNPDTENGTLTIRVKDTGVGIARNIQKRIFEPFVQSDVARDTHVYNGTGLGLAISRRLVERMNGIISLESESGKGCCFIICLDNVELADPASAAVEKQEENVSDCNLNGLRVLIVDDVPMNLKVLAALLRKLNSETFAVSSGTEALEVLKNQKADIVLTDMRMPGMNGAELAEKIHALPEYAGLPIVVVTADTESYDSAQMTHFDDILLKPVSFAKLANLLRKYTKI